MQALALANNVHLADMDGQVSPMRQQVVKVRWSDVVDTTHVENLVPPTTSRCSLRQVE